MKFEHRVVKCVVGEIPVVLGLASTSGDFSNHKPIGLDGWYVTATILAADGNTVVLILEREVE